MPIATRRFGIGKAIKARKRKARAKVGVRTVAAEEVVGENLGVVDAVVVAGERGVNFYS